MRPTKELLEIVKKEIVEKNYLSDYNNRNEYSYESYIGLCQVVWALHCLNKFKKEEYREVMDLIHALEENRTNTTKLDRPFFNEGGYRTRPDMYSVFLWKPYNLTPRINWLNKQILRHTK